MKKRTICSRAALLAVVFAGLSAAASDLYFSIEDDAKKYWDYLPGWKVNSGELRIPTEYDTLTFNSTYLDISRGRAPLQITNNVDAVCKTFWIASLKQSDQRVIGVKMTGGSLSTWNKDDASWWDEFTVGHGEGCFGSFEMTGGELRPYHAAIGVAGSGVFTNNGGRVVMQGTPGTSCFAIGLQKNAQGTVTMLDGLVTTAVTNNEGCFMSVGGSGVGTLNLQGGAISNIIVSMGTGNAGLGTLNLQGGDIWKYIRIGAGTSATGVVNMTGGTIHNNGSAGFSGYGVLNLTNGTITGDLYVGNQSTSTGVVNMTGGKIGGTIYVGQSGKGDFDFAGGTLGGQNLYIGHFAGSEGHVVLRAPLQMGNIYAGLNGNGVLDVNTNLTITYLKLGSSLSALGRINVSEAGVIMVNNQICVGGSTLPFGVIGNDGNLEVAGRGEIVMNGGSILYTGEASTSAVNLFLGRYAAKLPGAYGVLRGFGRIGPVSDGATNIRMAIGAGQVIADGGTLDLNSVVNVTNFLAGLEGDDPVNTSNGWYAVNGGYVRFPRTWYGGGASITRCIGAGPYSEHPDLVNSMRFTITQPSNDNNFFRGGVLAPDNENAHADALPANDGVAGIWTFGVFDSLLWSGKRNFTDILMKFHYDRTKVPEGRRVSLRRYEGGRWVRVGAARLVAGEPPYISTSKRLAPVPDAMNVGTFAVVVDKVGLTIIFR